MPMVMFLMIVMKHYLPKYVGFLVIVSLSIKMALYVMYQAKKCG